MVSISKSKDIDPEYEKFPLNHISYSAIQKLSTNPFMFKVNYMNGDYLDTTTGATGVLGSAMHKALEAYFGSENFLASLDDSENIKTGHAIGLKYINDTPDGFIEWKKDIPNRQSLLERYAFAFFGYIKELDRVNRVKDIWSTEKKLQYKVDVDGKNFPLPMKSYPDLVYEDMEGRVCIDDHKFCLKYSQDMDIDAGKLVQAAINYYTVFADTGKKPYCMRFREFKVIPNQDKSPQTRVYEIIYDENPLMFQLFDRLYEDMLKAMRGEMVFIPNFNAIYDKEVAILAYIHRLDQDEERERQFKKLKVNNVTDFLKKKVEKRGAMKKYLDVVTEKFISAQTLNYKNMQTHEKIKMKLAEHGLSVDFVDKIVGHSVEMYRYEPSVGLKMSKIEAYAKDIELVVETSGIRILAPIADSGLIGFEVPLKHRTFPKSLPEGDGFNVAVGVDIMGKVVRMDIREAPHMIVAGSTGSGKSVFISTLIRQLGEMDKSTVQLKFFDPKSVELSAFEEMGDYSDNPAVILVELIKLVKEMEARYKKLKAAKVKNLKEYRQHKRDLPYIFVFIEEYADLVMSNKDIQIPVLLLAQKARAAGIHIILTTQRPSTKIISGDIKMNFPTRVAFRTATGIDSQVIIDQYGAEKLLGKGDLLFQTPSINGLKRLQAFGE